MVQAHGGVTYPVRMVLNCVLGIVDERRALTSCKRATKGRDKS